MITMMAADGFNITDGAPVVHLGLVPHDGARLAASGNTDVSHTATRDVVRALADDVLSGTGPEAQAVEAPV